MVPGWPAARWRLFFLMLFLAIELLLASGLVIAALGSEWGMTLFIALIAVLVLRRGAVVAEKRFGLPNEKVELAAGYTTLFDRNLGVDLVDARNGAVILSAAERLPPLDASGDRALPGWSAARWIRVVTLLIVVAVLAAVGSLLAVPTVPLLAVFVGGLGLAGLITFMILCTRRIRREAKAGYSTVADIAELGLRDPRTGMLLRERGVQPLRSAWGNRIPFAAYRRLQP